MDNLERKVAKSVTDESENVYYQQYLKHQEEMQKIPLVPPPIHLLFNNENNKPQSTETEVEKPEQNLENSDAFECNDLPLDAFIEHSTSQNKQISKPKKKNEKKNQQPTEIGGYYDDPNYFYYEQDEEKE